MTKNLNKFYEDLMDDLSQDTDDRYVALLKERPETWRHENLIFDLRNLDSYYNCDGCKRRKPEAFCCSGYDVELTARDLKVVGERLPEVIKAYPRLKTVLGKYPFWRYGDSFERLIKRKGNDDCVFLIPGAKGCYLHAWAVDQGVDPIEVKPYICSLYPVVVIVIGDEIVITNLNEESKIILDAGEEASPCARARGKREEHAVIRSQELLTRMFGAELVEELIERILGKPGP